MADQRTHRAFRGPTNGQEFILLAQYTYQRDLGQGAYGVVGAATDETMPKPPPPPENSPQEVKDEYKRMLARGNTAVKKITNVFSKKILAKRALREIKLLKHFRDHPNITCVLDMDIPNPANFNEAYLYEDLMDCDLGAIIKSNQPLSYLHYQSFTHQMLSGLRYIHAANVLHRDLKPGNILVNSECLLKICDFGLARGFSVDPTENAGYMTEYVATRWYRAPEIMLSFQGYTKAIDVWSVGCIIAELLLRRPMFKGRDYVDQLNQILHILGTPDEETLMRIGSPRAREYVRNLPYMPRKSFKLIFPEDEYVKYDLKQAGGKTVKAFDDSDREYPMLLDIVARMLAFDPTRRVTVDEALNHRFLADWYDPMEHTALPPPFNFDFEVVEDVEELRQMILVEVQHFHNAVVEAKKLEAFQASQRDLQIDPTTSYGHPQDQGDVPRPEERGHGGYAQEDLEAELQGGLDARRGY